MKIFSLFKTPNVFRTFSSKMFFQICGFLMLFASFISLAYADVYEECEGRDQTYLAVQKDCSFYIFCHSEESFSDSCPEDSPYFSEEEQTCDSDKNVCGDRAVLIEDLDTSTLRTEIQTTAATSAPTKPLTGVSIIIPTHGSNLTSTSPFPISTASATSTSAPFIPTISLTSSAPQTLTTLQPPPLIPSSCPPVDNPNKAIFLPHSKSCSEYFLCYHGQRLPMHCSNMLHFSVRQQKCDYPENVKCHVSF